MTSQKTFVFRNLAVAAIRPPEGSADESQNFISQIKTRNSRGIAEWEICDTSDLWRFRFVVPPLR